MRLNSGKNILSLDDVAEIVIRHLIAVGELAPGVEEYRLRVQALRYDDDSTDAVFVVLAPEEEYVPCP